MRFRLEIDADDLQTLDAPGPVRDEIIYVYGTMCVHRSQVALSRIFMWSPNIYTMLTSGGASLQTFTSAPNSSGDYIDIFAMRVQIMPCKLKNDHWVLAYIDNRLRTISIMDSQQSPHEEVAMQLRNHLKDERQVRQGQGAADQTWTLNTIHPPKQPDDANSGVIVCAMINVLTLFHSKATRDMEFTDEYFQTLTPANMEHFGRQVQNDIIRGAVFHTEHYV